ncbi:MAG: glycosyltransferase family 2 protein [Halieaceae bacterium]|nr:glycosyltransferase family 2 protein [Halieaceae bacterium]
MQETDQDTRDQPLASVLLATHNGERWLPELLNSLLAQDYPALQWVIRDDASSDATPELLAAFRQRAGERVTLLENPGNQPEGALANFAGLVDHALTRSTAEVFLFCDQDDIWHQDKVSRLLAALPRDTDIPALVFSDMRVVDACGAPLADSFLDYQHLSPAAQLPRLLVQNHVSGCASLVNRATLELAWPLPPAAAMHDWWLALLCAAAGRLEHCPEALVDYRQHADNAVGAEGFNLRYLWRRARGSRGTRLAQLYAQAEALRERLQERGHGCPPALASFIATRELTRTRRLYALWSGGHTRSGLVRNLPLWLETE